MLQCLPFSMLLSLRGIMYNIHDRYGYLVIVTLACLHDLPHQTYTVLQQVTLNEHAPMYESESEV